jgi:hypothetical protein
MGRESNKQGLGSLHHSSQQHFIPYFQSNKTSHKSSRSHLQTTTIIIAMKLLLSALVGISVIKSGTGNNMLEGFEYIGKGYCKDSAGKRYSYFAQDLYNTNHNGCMQYCTQVRHPDFVGIEVENYGSFIGCSCDFSGGLPGDVDATDYIPSATFLYHASGVGPVQSSDGTSGVSCYRYTVSLFLVKRSSVLMCTSTVFN